MTIVNQVVDSMLRRYPDHPVYPYQREILETWLQPGIRIAGWSAARGAAKTAFAGRVLAEFLSGPLAQRGEEVSVVASSHQQASILMRDVHERYLAADMRAYGVGGQGSSRGRYRLVNNSNQLLIEDHAEGTKARVIGSDSRRAHGLRSAIIMADEPAQWQPAMGERLWSSLSSSLGKVEGSRLLAIGTRPADASHFWSRFLEHADLEEGTIGVVHAAPADADPYAWTSVQDANPGLEHGLPSARLLRQELAQARRDPAQLQTWRALRLNQGVAEVITDGDLLCPAEEWLVAISDALPDPAGGCVWGIDLGGARSLSAVAAYWPVSGLVQVRAAVGSRPDLEVRGRQDGARDLYRRAAASGELVPCGERLADVELLLTQCAAEWGAPDVVVADRHRYAEVLQVLDRFPPVEIVWRGRRTTDGATDVATFRSALDQRRLHVSPAQELLTWSISQARTRRNVAGQDYIHSGRGTRRDDLAVALVASVAEGERRRIEASRPPPPDLAIRIPSPAAPL